MQMLTVSYVKVFVLILSSSPTQFIPGQHLRVFEKFSYDAYGQNVRVLASGKEDNQTFFVDRLLLFREVKYRGLRINSKTYILQNSSLGIVLLSLPNMTQEFALLSTGGQL